MTRAQLTGSGIPPTTIARWIERERLIRVYRGVYALGHRQRNPINAAHAALLAGGPRSALAGASALVLWGIWRSWPRRYEIVVAGDRRPSGLTVHRSRTLVRSDITLMHGVRVTSPARTVLDTAPRLTGKQLTRAINDLRLRKLLTVDALAEVMRRNPNHRSVTLLEPHLERAQAEPTRSVLEDMFLDLAQKHGLPIPQINVHVDGVRVDAYFPDHNLIVQVDGWGGHRTRTSFVEDRRMDARILANTGIPTVRIPHEDVFGDSIAPLIALLRKRG